MYYHHMLKIFRSKVLASTVKKKKCSERKNDQHEVRRLLSAKKVYQLQYLLRTESAGCPEQYVFKGSRELATVL